MALRTLYKSFSAGELTPELFGRVDFPKFQEGLALCRNFITLPHGPAVNRPGTVFVKEVKDSTKSTRLLPFSYNNTQTFAIELGAGYFRFHTMGATLQYTTPAAWSSATAYNVGDLVANGGTNYYCVEANTNQAPPNATYWYALPADMTYEIPNSYAEADLFDIHYVQSADVLTLVHPNYAPQELRRTGATNWQLTTPTFTPPANVLTGVAVSNNGASTTPTSYSYVVTTLASGSLQESAPSATVTTTNDLTVAGRSNTVSWTDPSATGTNVRYNVYKEANGLFGYIGQAAGTSFVDNNITPDLSNTPPIADTVFNSTGNYPAAVSYFQQRRVFGGTTDAPQNVWLTRSGTESDMSYSIPTRDDDRIAARIAAREASSIRHIVPLTDLLLLTATCEWKIDSANSGALTPSTFSVKPQSYIGANNVTPMLVSNRVLYAASLGGHLWELAYSWQMSGYLPNDISLMAPHLFDYYTINDMAYARGPIPIVWCVSSTGQLLGMTYVPDQAIAAWHHHDTGASDKFEAVCAVMENNIDMLYCIVNRTINGVQKRYVEQLHSRLYNTLADAFYVDCGSTYSGAATNSVSGLNWLEGMTVSILADGAVQPQQKVTSGTITLPSGVTASTIQVGLPITADLQTLPVAGYVDYAFGQGRPKNVDRAWLRLYRSSGVYVGPDENHLTPYAQRTNEPYGSPPNLISDEIEVALTPDWSRSGQIFVRQSDPLPLDVAAITVQVAVGGG